MFRVLQCILFAGVLSVGCQQPTANKGRHLEQVDPNIEELQRDAAALAWIDRHLLPLIEEMNLIGDQLEATNDPKEQRLLRAEFARAKQRFEAKEKKFWELVRTNDWSVSRQPPP